MKTVLDAVRLDVDAGNKELQEPRLLDREELVPMGIERGERFARFGFGFGFGDAMVLHVR